MNELQVKTEVFEPAKIKFNKEQIETQLQENLKKYEGLVFTEENTSELRSTLAELRKGKKAIDEYRKQTKKELNDPVKQFEDDCKELNAKFDDVINPLAKQLDNFETERKAKKQVEIESFINRIVNDYGLDNKFASELVVEDEYLAKSRSMKEIEGTLTFKADKLKTQQNKEAADKQFIKSKVELVNERYGVSLSESAYVRLLEYKDADSIKGQIIDDGQDEAEKRIHEQKRAEEKARQEELESLKEEAEFDKEQIEEEESKSIPFDPQPIDEKTEIPFDPAEDELMPDPFAVFEPFVELETKTKTYTVTATKDEHASIEEFIVKNISTRVDINE